MTTFTRELPDSELLRSFGGAYLPATTGEAMAAAASDPRLRLTEELMTESEIQRETGFEEPPDRGMVDPETAMVESTRIDKRLNPQELTPMVEPDALNEEFGYLGLKFDKPTRRGVVEILAAQKRDDLIRQDVLSRAPGGIAGTGAVLAASLAGSIIDPLNVATAFIPIVGEARYAVWAAKLGPTFARLARGTVEGVVGNAMIEPGVFYLSRQQQLDYEMTDALLNIGLGGAIGGGLHVVGGKFGDLLARQTPEVREAALRSAVAQAATGRTIDVEPVLRAEAPAITPESIGRRVDVEKRVREIVSDDGGIDAIRIAGRLAGDRDALVAEIKAIQKGPERAEGLVQFLKRSGGLREEDGELKNLGITSKTLPGLIRKKGRSFDDAARAAWEAGLFPGKTDRPTVSDFLELLDEEVNRGRKASRIEDRKAEDSGLERALSDIGMSAGDDPEFVADVVQRLANEPPFGRADTGPIRRDDIARMMKREAAIERQSAVDLKASERAVLDAETSQDARLAADEAAEDLAALRDAGELDEDLAGQLGVADEIGLSADGWARAVRQAGYCMQ